MKLECLLNRILQTILGECREHHPTLSSSSEALDKGYTFEGSSGTRDFEKGVFGFAEEN